MKTVVSDVRFLQRGTMCFGDLHIEDGYVERIDYKTPKPYSDIAVNGFVDIHTHGFRGISAENSDPQALQELAIQYAKRGTVGFAATLNCLSFAEYEAIFEAYRKAFQGEYLGARFYGIHVEGPYLNKEMANDLDKAKIKDIDLIELEQFLRKHHDIIKVMSIAPELAHGQEAIALLRHYGVAASVGHTKATYDDMKKAIANGLHQVTHLCNAMNEIDHHQVGIMDAIIEADCMCELNMDGVHVHRSMLAWLIRLLGSDRIMAISDGTAYSGFEYPNGYVLDESHVVKNNAIYCHDHLSSSFRDLLDAFQYLYYELQLPLEDCIKMTSTNAGKLLNTLNYEIDLGKKADLVILDHNGELKDVIMRGHQIL